MLGSVAHGMARAFQSFNRTYRPRNAFRGRRAPGSAEPPRTFARFRDSKGRFVLSYPADWSLRAGDGVQVSSARLGSFARVDLLPDTPRFWEELKREFARAGEEVEYVTRNGSDPVHVRGRVRARGTNFRWDAYAYRLGDRRLVLSLGNVVDARRSRAIEKYEDGVLAAVRRHFRVRGRKA